MNYDNSYFQDEIREGFFVSAKMKHFWAAQIGVLENVEKICKAHNLRFWAAYGTLLGTVRHGGYIPWDDDLDICMMRNEVEEFIKYAREELPEGYIVLDIASVGEYDNTVVRVVNSGGINFSNSFLQNNYGCPYCVGVDIFPIDNLASEPQLVKEQCNLLHLVAGYRKKIANNEKLSTCELESIKQISSMCTIDLSDSKVDLGLLNKISDALMTQYNKEETEYVTVMGNYIRNDSQIFSKKVFEKTFFRSFEGYKMPIPGRYDDILSVCYSSSYAVPHRGEAAHEYPVFESQDETLNNTIGHGWYEYMPSNYIKLDRLKTGLRSEIITSAELLYESTRVLSENIGIISANDVINLLQNNQNLAITIGEKIEKIFSAKYSANLISKLEDYCEEIYFLYTAIAEGENEKISHHSTEILNVSNCVLTDIKQIMLSVNTVIYLVSRIEWWDRIEALLFDDFQNDNLDVKLYVIPWYERTYDGNLGTAHFEIDLFKEKFANNKQFNQKLSDICIPCENMDVIREIQSLDAYRIITQDLYEDYNPSYSIYPELYASNLRKYCNELICVPPIFPCENACIDEISLSALRPICITPSIFAADKIYFPNTQVKEAFITNLEGVLDEKDRDNISKRFYVIDELELKKNTKSAERDSIAEELINHPQYRKLIFFMGAESFECNPEDAIIKLRRIMDIFHLNRNKLKVYWIEDDNVKFLEDNTKCHYTEIVQDFIDSNIGEYLKSELDIGEYISEASAYYGDVSYIMSQMLFEHKPVMKLSIKVE